MASRMLRFAPQATHSMVTLAGLVAAGHDLLEIARADRRDGPRGSGKAVKAYSSLMCWSAAGTRPARCHTGAATDLFSSGNVLPM